MKCFLLFCFVFQEFLTEAGSFYLILKGINLSPFSEGKLDTFFLTHADSTLNNQIFLSSKIFLDS